MAVQPFRALSTDFSSFNVTPAKSRGNGKVDHYLPHDMPELQRNPGKEPGEWDGRQVTDVDLLTGFNVTPAKSRGNGSPELEYCQEIFSLQRNPGKEPGEWPPPPPGLLQAILALQRNPGKEPGEWASEFGFHNPPIIFNVTPAKSRGNGRTRSLKGIGPFSLQRNPGKEPGEWPAGGATWWPASAFFNVTPAKSRGNGRQWIPYSYSLRSLQRNPGKEPGEWGSRSNALFPGCNFKPIQEPCQFVLPSAH